MTVSEFADSVRAALPYRPNGQQNLVIDALARFVSPARAQASGADRVFVLNGYAGTGKTSLTGALVKALHAVNIPTLLLAPTGRAAKVFAANAGVPAYTIHRKIYRHSLNGEMPGMQENNTPGMVFIVDEASMIAGQDNEHNLLADLLMYVFAAPACRLILLGDTAQLPPVGCDFSPAMDMETLRSYGLSVSRATLTAIARQDAMSGILANATWQRRAMREDPMPLPRLFTANYPDVSIVIPEDLPEIIDGAYRRDGLGETIIITRSNRRATEFNLAIRRDVLYLEEEIVAGDLLLVAKNNYHWSRGVKGLDFIANGDILEVVRVYGTERRYGLRFADLQVRMPVNDITFDTKIILNPLTSDTAALPREQMIALYEGIIADPDVIAPGAGRADQLKLLRNDKYWNALQVKYAYAVTCHKAQGGQWENVIVDMTYIAPESIGLEFYRWLYTATTRARSTLAFLQTPDAD